MKEAETNPHKIEQRQKQVDFGKNTLGYENYRKQVAKCAPSPPCASCCPYIQCIEKALKKHGGTVRPPPLGCLLLGHPATPHHG